MIIYKNGSKIAPYEEKNVFSRLLYNYSTVFDEYFNI